MFNAWWSGKTCTKSKHNSAKRRYRQKLRVWFSGRGLGCHVQALDSMITIIQNEKHKELHRWISKSWSGHQSGFYRDTDPIAHGFGAERGLEGWGGVRDWIYFEELVHVLIEAGKVKTCHAGWRSEGELLAQLEPKDAYWQNPLFLREYQSSFLFLCVSVHMCVWVSSPVLTLVEASDQCGVSSSVTPSYCFETGSLSLTLGPSVPARVACQWFPCIPWSLPHTGVVDMQSLC